MTVDWDKEARASREATEWLIRLQDAPHDPHVSRSHAAWLTADPLNAAAWALTQRTSAMLASVPPAYATRWADFVSDQRTGAGVQGAPHQQHADTISHHKVRRRNGWRLSLSAGAIALAASIGFIVGPALVCRLHADYMTQTAEVRIITLADGSKVTLAPGSAISIAYSAAERRIRLLSGEAFFTVEHDPGRPFVVAADLVEATDVGTAFDVRLADSYTYVAVQQGSVRIDYRNASALRSETLDAHETLQLARSGDMTRGSAPVEQVAAWRRRQLIAQDQSMEDVVDQLRPYFRGEIVLANAGLKSRSVTGVYNLSDPVTALRGIAEAHGALVRQISPWLLVVSGG